jgi:hypothetical protein
MERRTYTRQDGDGDHVSDEVVVVEEQETAPTTRATAAYDNVETTRTSVTYWDSPAARVNSVLFVLLLGLESLLALRFALLAFGANLANDFVDFIMDVSGFFVEPFEGAFSNRTWDEGILEINTLLAMGVYFVVYLLLAMLITAVMPKMHTSDGTTHRHGGRSAHV